MENVHGGAHLKKRLNPDNEVSDRGAGLRMLYADMFRGYGILPGDIAKQNPFILFKMMDMLHMEGTQNETAITNDYLRVFYGM